MRTMLMLAIAAAGCGGDEPPSCQQAVTHYYDTGCVLVSPTTGQPFTAGEVIQNCKELLAAAPASCVDDLENLRVCFNSVQAPATNASCDCSQEQDALLTCE